MYRIECTAEFDRWLNRVSNGPVRFSIIRRIRAIAHEGHLLGDWRQVAGGVFELRFQDEARHRVYLARRGYRLVLLLGGAGRIRGADAVRAAHLWRRWKKLHGNRIF
ncbi:type II toxin-antitoxin system RelE/ParE family toxin [Collinsella tanakaei]|nr:type II toxin-antitoxin system RelE/ParE family toxin [Collinsella tanakaei]